MVGVGEGGLVIEEGEYSRAPVFWGDPRELSMDELDKCRFSFFKSMGSLDTKVNNAVVSFFYEAMNRQAGERIYHSGKSEAERMRVPFVMKWPDDFEKLVNKNRTMENVEELIMKGFSAGLEVMNKHAPGGVGDGERVLFNPQLDNVRVECKDGKVLSGQSVLGHELEHAKKYHELTGKSGYIVVELRVDSDDDGRNRMKIDGGFMQPSEYMESNHKFVKRSLSPMLPSFGDYEHALGSDLQGSLELIMQKPWWGLLETTIKEKLKVGLRLGSAQVLSEITDELMRLVEQQARRSDGFEERPALPDWGFHYIDKEKIKRIYTKQ